MTGSSPPITRSTITCPACGAEHEADMPEDACVVFYACGACGETLRPQRGDCCVFCSHGSVACPPEQGG